MTLRKKQDIVKVATKSISYSAGLPVDARKFCDLLIFHLVAEYRIWIGAKDYTKPIRRLVYKARPLLIFDMIYDR